MPLSSSSSSSSCSAASEDTVILNFTMCDPREEAAALEESQPKKPCHVNFELMKKSLQQSLLFKKNHPGVYKNKITERCHRRQMINTLTAEMTQTHGTFPSCQSVLCTGDCCSISISGGPIFTAWICTLLRPREWVRIPCMAVENHPTKKCRGKSWWAKPCSTQTLYCRQSVI